MRRKRVMPIALVIAFALVASACGDESGGTTTADVDSGGTTTAEVPASTSAEPSATTAAVGGCDLPTEPIEISFWAGSEAPQVELEMELIAEFEAMHPNITVQYEQFGDEEAFDNLVISLPAGEETPTMALLSQVEMPVLVAQDLLAAANPACFGAEDQAGLIALYTPNSLDAVTYNDAIYGIPIQSNTYSFFINNRLFEEAGLDPVADAPTTWDEVAALQDLFYVEDDAGQVIQKGFEYRNISNGWLSATFMGMLYSADNDILDEDDNPVFNDENGVRAMDDWVKNIVAPEITYDAPGSPYNDFAQEFVAMATGGPNALEFIFQLNESLRDNVTVVSMPKVELDTFQSYGYHDVVNVNAPQDEQNAAWALIAYMTQFGAEWFERTGLLQPRLGWADTPEAQAFPFLDVFLGDLEKSRPLPKTPNFSALQTAVGEAVSRVTFEGADPQESLDQAAAEYLAAIGR